MIGRGLILSVLASAFAWVGQVSLAAGIAFLVSQGPGTPLMKESEAALRCCQTLRNCQPIYLEGPERFVDEQKQSVRLTQFDVVWCHQGDLSTLPADLQNPGTVEALRGFVAEGKGLFLSGVAARLVVEMGLETASMRIVAPGHDSFQAALVPVVKDHPVFASLPSNPIGVIFFTSGGYPAFADFYKSPRPLAGRLLARSNYADENPLVEYRLGKGRIIVLGWRIPNYSLAHNVHRKALEQLTCNILDYLSDRTKWVEWPEQPLVTGLSTGSEIPTVKELSALRAAIEDLMTSFGERYPRGQIFQQRLNELVAACDDLRNQSSVDSQSIAKVRRSFLELQRQALVDANPLLDFDELL
ncbi:hypothetical protein, partial [Thermogutta sp.]